MYQLFFKTIDSTNLYLKEHFEELPHLTFVRAGFQSQGRGSHGRDWRANEGDNLLFSILIKDPRLLAAGPFLSLVSGASVANFIESELGVSDISIKWPNDIYCAGKKICGILVEGNLEKYLSVGIGLNVNQRSFEGEYRYTPSSLFLETGNEFDLDILAESLFLHLEKALKSYVDEKPFLTYFRAHNFLLGRKIMAQGEEGEFVVTGVSDSFSLLCHNEKKPIEVVSGEIKLIP